MKRLYLTHFTYILLISAFSFALANTNTPYTGLPNSVVILFNPKDVGTMRQADKAGNPYHVYYYYLDCMRCDNPSEGFEATRINNKYDYKFDFLPTPYQDRFAPYQYSKRPILEKFLPGAQNSTDCPAQYASCCCYYDPQEPSAHYVDIVVGHSFESAAANTSIEDITGQSTVSLPYLNLPPN